MTALRELIEAVEANELLETDWSFGRWPKHLSWDQVSAAYLGSLDAARALHEAVLPGWYWDCGTENLDDVTFFGRVESPHIFEGSKEIIGHADNPARAWLLAILKALEAQS